MLPFRLFTIFCILWSSVLSHVDEEGRENENQTLRKSDSSELYEALTIIYYPDEHLYSLADTQTIQRISSRPAFGPNYSHVLLLCPEEYEKPYLKMLHVLNIIVVYERNIEIHNTRICKHSYKPGRSGYGNIGYYISSISDAKPIRKHLQSISKLRAQGDFFPLMQVIQVDEMFWLNPIQTTHTFVSYKHFLSTNSLISCSYPSIPDERGPNVSNALEHQYEIDLTPFYQKEHQDKILQKFVHQQGQYFVRQQLVPVDDFVDEPSRRATCYNLNTVPIWKPIVEGPIKIIEKFIRYVAQMLDINTLSVTTRAHGYLKLPLVEEPQNKDRLYLYLDHKQKGMPVPEIFIKILHYRVRVQRHKNNEDKSHSNVNGNGQTSSRDHHNESYETENLASDEKEEKNTNSSIGNEKGHVSSSGQEIDETLSPDLHKKDEPDSALSPKHSPEDHKMDEMLFSDQQGKDQEQDYNKDDATDKALPSDQHDEGDHVEDHNPSPFPDSHNKNDGKDTSFEDHIKGGFSSSSEQDEDEEYEEKHYYILIAVHNELQAPLTNKLCETDICDINGFIMTKNDDERKMYYCCAIDNLLLPEYRNHLLPLEHHFETFNLNDVPTKIDEEGIIVTTIQIPTYLNKVMRKQDNF